MHGNIYKAANLVLIHSRREVIVSSVTQTDSKLLVLLHSLFNMSAIKLTIIAIVVAAFVALCKGEDSSLDIIFQREYLSAFQHLVNLLMSYCGSRERCSGESTRLPQMWLGIDWVEFVVGSLLCSKRFFSRYSGFPLSSETNISNF